MGEAAEIPGLEEVVDGFDPEAPLKSKGPQ